MAMQHVSKTENMLHICVNGHRSDNRHNHPNRPVAIHFNMPGYLLNKLSVMALVVWICMSNKEVGSLCM